MTPLLKACLNGRHRRGGDHPALPLTAARLAAEHGHGIRVGLEDTFVLPDGQRAADNGALVAAAAALSGRTAL